MNIKEMGHDFGMRMILIDDDPTYCAIMRKVAAKKNISLDIFPSIMDVSDVAGEIRGAYLAAIVDFDLGLVTGVEITGYLSALLGEVPMILVSSTDRSEDLRGAAGRIKTFINKSAGYDSILEQAALATHSTRLAS